MTNRDILELEKRIRTLEFRVKELEKIVKEQDYEDEIPDYAYSYDPVWD